MQIYLSFGKLRGFYATQFDVVCGCLWNFYIDSRLLSLLCCITNWQSVNVVGFVVGLLVQLLLLVVLALLVDFVDAIFLEVGVGWAPVAAVGEDDELMAGGNGVVVLTVCWVKISAGISPSLTLFFCFMRRFWNQILT